MPNLLFLRSLLVLALPLFHNCLGHESDSLSQIRRISGQAYKDNHNIPTTNHSLAVTSFPHKPLFRWDASDKALDEATTVKTITEIAVEKKKKKGLKRKKKDKSNVWWPWANYEEWLANHKRDSATKKAEVAAAQKRLPSDSDAAQERNKKRNNKKKKKRGRNKNRKNKKSNNETVGGDKEATGAKKKKKTKARAEGVPKIEKEQMQNMPPQTEPPPGVLYLTAAAQTTSAEAPHRRHDDEDNEIRQFHNQWMPSWKSSLSKVTRRNFTSDKNECLVNNGGCEGLCINTPGSYYCHCPQGFRLDASRTKCLDVNECLLRNGHGPCQGECRNRWGGYDCGCATVPGTELAADRRSCRPRDSCATANCSHICINTRSGPFCACPQGYVLGQDWKTCQDVDECLQPELQEPKCDGHCVNTIGSYICS